MVIRWRTERGVGSAGDGREQTYLIHFFSLLAGAFLGLFGLMHIAEGTPTLGILEITSAAALVCNTIWLRVTNNVIIARFLLMCCLLAIMVVMLVTGGTYNTGIFWIFAFPAAAFFLTGHAQGVIWMAGLYAMILLILLMAQMPLITLPYDLMTIRQLLLALFVVSLAIYMYQRNLETAKNASSESRQNLQDYVDLMTTYTATLSPSGEVLLANKAARAVWGMNKATGQVLFQEGEWWKFDVTVHATVKKAFRRALKGEMIAYVERMLPVGASTEQIVELILSPVHEGGQVTCVVFEGRDITAQKRAQDQLEEKTAALERLNKLMVGRELKMMQLKQELRKLKGGV